MLACFEWNQKATKRLRSKDFNKTNNDEVNELKTTNVFHNAVV